jgi:protein phosphatase-4 regulatory subunit 3
MVSSTSLAFTGILNSFDVAAAFRIFRLLLKQNNPNSHKIIKKHDIMKPILDLTIQESLRDNLLSCSCQEFFEIMRKVS